MCLKYVGPTNDHDTGFATTTAVAAACWHILMRSKGCCNVLADKLRV